MTDARRPLLERIRSIWATAPQAAAVELLRVGLGCVWALNLVFVLAPSNQFFSTFADTALSFEPTTLGGPGVADFVAANAVVFSAAIAGTTAYLAVALLLGATTRLACWIGIAFSSVLLLTQVGSTFLIPGGTDVGPHPLYLLIYLVLILGRAGRYFAFDHWMWERGHVRFPRLSRWVASPR
ncbi:MAG TPA: hypothetical protein VEY07_05010 [Thermoplasmata archaeon]|nr:hypothetical protein [Thermoplasmata archaeon]